MADVFETGLNYNSPNGNPSTIDASNNNAQMQTYLYLKEAIIESQKERYFLNLDSSNVTLPKHYGKAVKRYAYIPLLDDRNVNDQGIDASGTVIADGNIYGSSKDIGTITSKLPTLTENGGRVNRVGFTRIIREGSIRQMGFFYEFTRDSLDFDSDANLQRHLARELVNGATEMAEDLLQIDLLTQAGVVMYGGEATDDDEITAEGGTPSVLTYEMLKKLSQILDDNRCPMQTRVVSGSRNIDTRVLPSCRVAFCGSELESTLENMVDGLGRPAWVPVEQYAAATTPMNGEIGKIANFRVIKVPEMLHWAGEGAAVTDNPGYMATNDKYDVFPFLVVGDDSFSTIGFQTDGYKLNFDIITKMPGTITADRHDPYGLNGFSSIKFYTGSLIDRPERIAVCKVVAPI